MRRVVRDDAPPKAGRGILGVVAATAALKPTAKSTAAAKSAAAAKSGGALQTRRAPAAVGGRSVPTRGVPGAPSVGGTPVAAASAVAREAAVSSAVAREAARRAGAGGGGGTGVAERKAGDAEARRASWAAAGQAGQVVAPAAAAARRPSSAAIPKLPRASASAAAALDDVARSLNEAAAGVRAAATAAVATTLSDGTSDGMQRRLSFKSTYETAFSSDSEGEGGFEAPPAKAGVVVGLHANSSRAASLGAAPERSPARAAVPPSLPTVGDTFSSDEGYPTDSEAEKSADSPMHSAVVRRVRPRSAESAPVDEAPAAASVPAGPSPQASPPLGPSSVLVPAPALPLQERMAESVWLAAGKHSLRTEESRRGSMVTMLESSFDDSEDGRSMPNGDQARLVAHELLRSNPSSAAALHKFSGPPDAGKLAPGALDVDMVSSTVSPGEPESEMGCESVPNNTPRIEHLVIGSCTSTRSEAKEDGERVGVARSSAPRKYLAEGGEQPAPSGDGGDHVSTTPSEGSGLPSPPPCAMEFIESGAVAQESMPNPQPASTPPSDQLVDAGSAAQEEASIAPPTSAREAEPQELDASQGQEETEAAELMPPAKVAEANANDAEAKTMADAEAEIAEVEELEMRADNDELKTLTDEAEEHADAMMVFEARPLGRELDTPLFENGENQEAANLKGRTRELQAEFGMLEGATDTATVVTEKVAVDDAAAQPRNDMEKLACESAERRSPREGTNGPATAQLPPAPAALAWAAAAAAEEVQSPALGPQGDDAVATEWPLSPIAALPAGDLTEEALLARLNDLEDDRRKMSHRLEVERVKHSREMQRCLATVAELAEMLATERRVHQAEASNRGMELLATVESLRHEVADLRAESRSRSRQPMQLHDVSGGSQSSASPIRGLASPTRRSPLRLRNLAATATTPPETLQQLADRGTPAFSNDSCSPEPKELSADVGVDVSLAAGADAVLGIRPDTCAADTSAADTCAPETCLPDTCVDADAVTSTRCSSGFCSAPTPTLRPCASTPTLGPSSRLAASDPKGRCGLGTAIIVPMHTLGLPSTRLPRSTTPRLHGPLPPYWQQLPQQEPLLQPPLPSMQQSQRSPPLTLAPSPYCTPPLPWTVHASMPQHPAQDCLRTSNMSPSRLPWTNTPHLVAPPTSDRAATMFVGPPPWTASRTPRGPSANQSGAPHPAFIQAPARARAGTPQPCSVALAPDSARAGTPQPCGVAMPPERARAWSPRSCGVVLVPENGTWTPQPPCLTQELARAWSCQPPGLAPDGGRAGALQLWGMAPASARAGTPQPPGLGPEHGRAGTLQRWGLAPGTSQPWALAIERGRTGTPQPRVVAPEVWQAGQRSGSRPRDARVVGSMELPVWMMPPMQRASSTSSLLRGQGAGPARHQLHTKGFSIGSIPVARSRFAWPVLHAGAESELVALAAPPPRQEAVDTAIELRGQIASAAAWACAVGAPGLLLCEAPAPPPPPPPPPMQGSQAEIPEAPMVTQGSRVGSSAAPLSAVATPPTPRPPPPSCAATAPTCWEVAPCHASVLGKVHAQAMSLTRPSVSAFFDPVGGAMDRTPPRPVPRTIDLRPAPQEVSPPPPPPPPL